MTIFIILTILLAVFIGATYLFSLIDFKKIFKEQYVENEAIAWIFYVVCALVVTGAVAAIILVLI